MVTIRIKSSLCKGCLLCVAVCNKGVLAQARTLNEQGVAAVEVRQPDRCVGCGQCVLMCPDNCIIIERSP